MTDFARRGTVAALLAVSLIAVSHRAEGARQAPRSQPPPAAAQAQLPPAALQAQTPPARVVAPADAEQTREALRQILDRYPQTVGRVLALDPTLLQNPVYLEPYPELIAFLQQHPEVARNGADFLANFSPSYRREPDRQTQVIRLWESLFTGIAVFLVFSLVTSALIWLVKTLVDYRRWYRLSKVQTEAHNKLLDRFTNNEELLAYIATPSGKRFLESAPIMLDTASTSIGAPVKRILWAIEIGVVMVCLGIGIYFAQTAVPAEVSPVLFAVSIVVTALGVGFVLASGASYLLSRRLGILGGAASRQVGDADAQPGA
jgi:cytochrome c biogenesis protein CcdA